MKVLVLWADNASANMGVRVLAQGMEELARQAWGPETDVDFQDFGPGDHGLAFGRRSVMRDLGRRSGPIKKRLREFDVIVNSGAGDSFTDIYGLKRLLTLAYVQRVSQRLGIPIVLGPQTIGPFRTVLGRSLAGRYLKRAAVVEVRDSKSAEAARKLGRPADVVGTDVVFLLPKVEVVKSRDVIFNVSGLLWEKNGHVDNIKYQQSVRRLIRELHASGRSVSLMAHVVDNVSTDNDVPAGKLLQDEFGSQLELLVPSDLQEARSMLASAALVIGSRMHACLNAISCGTPAIPWAYSRKFEPLLADLGWSTIVDLRSEPDPVSATLGILEVTSGADWATQLIPLRSRVESRGLECIRILADFAKGEPNES